MAYFPSLGPFYDPTNEQEVFNGSDGRLKSRNLPRAEGQTVSPSPGKEKFSQRHQSDSRGPDKVGANWTPYVSQKQGDVCYVDPNSRNDNRVTTDSYLYFQRFASEPVKQYNGYVDYEVSNTNSDGYRQRGEHASKSSQDSAFSERANISHRNHRNDYRHIHRIEDVTDFRYSRNEIHDDKMWKDENFNDRTSTDSHGGNSRLLHDSFDKHSDVSVQSRKSYDVQRWKDVVLMPNFQGVQTTDGGVVLCEKLFGIILFQYNHKPGSGRSRNTDSEDVLKDRKVIVQGLAPNSAAERSGKVHRGDMLISVNDSEVTWLNVDKLFQTIRRKKSVKLTLQSPVIVGPKPPVPPRPNLPRQDIYKRVIGCHIRDGQKKLAAIPYTLLYLTLTESKEDMGSATDDIVYMYPPNSTGLVNIRGLFLTLSSSLADVTNFNAKNTSVQLQNELIHLAYTSENKDVLVLGLPANSVPLQLLNQVMDDLVRLLKLMFGGLSRAFRDGDKEQLDQLFALTFHQLLSNQSTSISPVEELPSCATFLASLSAIRTLHLTQEYELICDEILSEFEAADFDEFMEEDELVKRRAFMVLGSSLFYKDFQLCTHLSPSDNTDLHLFLRHHSLLQLMSQQSVDEVMVWQEVWPSDIHPGVPGYQTPKTRCFFLIVGMKHFLLGCVLAMGGCTQWSTGKINPHPLYVDQAKATLLQLEADDVTMAEWCEERLLSDTGSVSLVGAERYLTRSKSSKDDSILVSPMKPSGSPKTPSSPMRSQADTAFRYRSSPLADRKPGNEGDPDRSPSTEHSTPVMTRQGSKLSYGSNESGGSGSSTGAPRSKSSRKSFQNDMSSVSRSLSALQVEEVPLHGSFNKITRGSDNVLFHYVQLYDIEGVYVTATDHELASVQGAIHCQLLENFYRCSLQIRKVFARQKEVQELGTSKPHPRFGLNNTQVDLEEHGVMFRHMYLTSPETKKNPSVLSYWVVGRRFPPPDCRELYVCFHESTTQSLTELAFNLGFGVMAAT